MAASNSIIEVETGTEVVSLCSSYISDKLVNILGKRPVLTKNRQIDMMLSTVNRQIEIYNVEVENLKGDFKLAIDVSKVDREVLLSV